MILVVVDNDFDSDPRVTKEVDILQNHGIDYLILCYDFGKSYKNDNRKIRIKNGIFLKKVGYMLINRFPFINWVWASKIKRILKNNPITHIHVHDLYMMEAVILALKNIKNKPKVLLDLHENYPVSIMLANMFDNFLIKKIVNPEKWKEKEGRLLEHADVIITLSKEFGTKLLEKYPSLNTKKMVEFPNYPNFDLLEKVGKEIKTPHLPRPTMCYFGYIAESRGLGEVFRAQKALIESGTKISFLIIGPVSKYYQSKFDEFLGDEVLRNFVHHIPWIEVNQLKNYLEVIDFALAPFWVNPQIESGISNKVFQYLYFRRPVIVSNAKPMANLIKTGQCGLVFKDQEELKKSIKFMVDHPDEVKKMGENGHRTILEKYNPEIFESRLLEVWR